MRIFRAVCLGAFFHVMLLIVVLMQLYFDLRRQALNTCLFFLFANGLLAVWSVDGGLTTYGFGYAIAGLLALLAGYTQLAQSMEHLDFYVFTNQPIPTAKAGDPHGTARKSEEEREEEDDEDSELVFPEDGVFEWIDAYEDQADEDDWEGVAVTQGVGEFAWTEAAERKKEATKTHGPEGEPKEDTETHGPDEDGGPAEDTKTHG